MNANRNALINQIHSSIAKPAVWRIVKIQLVLLAVISLPLLIVDAKLAQSVVVGGLIQVVPQAWFNQQAFRYSGARQTGLILRSMYWGQAGKLLLTVALFSLAFGFLEELDIFALLITFVVMVVVHLVLAHKIIGSRP